MTWTRLAGATLAVTLAFSASAAHAGCVTKAARATAGSEASAKWYVMETMVQAVSWGLWPGWLSNGKVAGHKVRNERYSCKADGGQVTCRGRADFCTTG
ncbi:MAG: hypothetical protein CTY31_11850 [Hyphomicrobium sp.]|nr:MAG: hypothetical protein CTY39_03700 [Hyphomicrobium sp.]PPC98721.1 MAG: hypothetical protein CTY31_11850 [Hyphomicrobium sp.]